MPNFLKPLALLAVLMAGCTPPPRVVEVQVPVPVPGPIRYREIAADLLRCAGKPPSLRDGMTGGELIIGARAWQAYGQCLEGRLEEIGRLGSPDFPSR